MTREGASRPSFEARKIAHLRMTSVPVIENWRYTFTTPHHSAMNSAVALVDFRNESRSTYSLKPCIAAPLAPKHRLWRSLRHFSRCRFQNRSHANTLRDLISRPMETRMPGNRNIMYLIIGALIVAVGVLGYNLYQTKKEPEGLQINLGPNGLKIQNK